jgi:hypothetical protein
VVKHQQLARQVGAFGAIVIKSLTDLKIINMFSMMACASNHSYRLPLRRCLNNSRLVASSDLKMLHWSFTTVKYWIMLRISTYDPINIKINLLGNFFHAERLGDSTSTHILYNTESGPVSSSGFLLLID